MLYPDKYIGDAVYASYDGYQIKLRTGDGNNNVIFLDRSTLLHLVEYAKNLGLIKGEKDV